MATPAATANIPTRTSSRPPGAPHASGLIGHRPVTSCPAPGQVRAADAQARWSYAEQMAEVAVVTDSTSSLGPDQAATRRGRGRPAAGRDRRSQPSRDRGRRRRGGGGAAGRSPRSPRRDPAPEIIRRDLCRPGRRGVLRGRLGAPQRSDLRAPVRAAEMAAAHGRRAGDRGGQPDAGHGGRVRRAVRGGGRARRPAARRRWPRWSRRSGRGDAPRTSTSTRWSTCAAAAGSDRRPPCSAPRSRSSRC